MKGPKTRLVIALLLLCSLSSSRVARAQSLVQQGNDQCGPHCAVILTDGSDATAPPYFQQAVMNDSITEIVLAAPRYQLKPAAWAEFGSSKLYTLTRNLTIRSTFKPYGLMDFQLLERKVLVDAGVTVTFSSVVLQNVKKLGGFGLDFFVGNTGSQITLQDVVRVKLACQLPVDVLKSARTYTRVSSAFPNNTVVLLPRFCFTAALAYGLPEQHCYQDALHFKYFSMISSSNDPDSGSQFPGYVLFQENTTRACEYTITKECLAAHDGDEELCLAMLVTQALQGNQQGFTWTPGAIAGVSVAGAVVLVALALLTHYRNHIVLWCVRLDGKSIQDLESGSSHQAAEVEFSGKELSLEGDNAQSYVQRRAISQQVTLGVLLGAGSFGRVYKGRWHSSDVAIKIMSCTRAELGRVLREAEVMMQLNHPNIVRAFQASVWNPAEQARALQAREVRGSSTGGAAGKKAPSKRSSSRLSPAIGNSLQQQQQQQQQQRTSTAPSSSPLVSGQVGTGSFDNDISTAGASASGVAITIAPAAAAAAPVPPPTPATAAGGAQDSSVELTFLPVTVPWANAMQSGGAAAPPAPASLDRSVNDTAHQWGQQGAAAAGQQQGVDSSVHVVELGNGVSAASINSSSACHVDGAGSSSATFAGMHQQQQQQSGSAVAASGSNASAVAEAREGSSPPEAAAAAATPAAAAAAPAPAGGARFKQHLLGKLRRSSSGSSTPVRGSDAAAAAGGSSGTAAAAAAAAAGAGAGFSSSNSIDIQQQQQQGDLDGSGRSSDKQRRKWQEREQEHASAELAAAAAGAAAESSEGNTEEGQRSEVQVWLVLELCTGGTLKDAVTTGRLRLENNIGLVKLYSRLLETANGMAYLHSKGVLHGDLKAGNVLLQNVHGSFDQVAKISDFGLAAVLLDGATHRSTASMGTITHMAPEVLRSGHISPAADVYSFAIMMWEVFTSRQAYQGLHYGTVVERVVIQKQRPTIPDDMPQEYSLLMSTCWDAEPTSRPSFQQIARCLELMISTLTNETEAAAWAEEDGKAGGEGSGSGALHHASSSAAAAAAVGSAAGTAGRLSDPDVGGSSDQVAAVASGAFAGAGGAGGSTGGSNASGWQQHLQLLQQQPQAQQQQQQQQRVVYPVPLLPPVAIAGRASTGSHSGPHVGILTPTQLQQQRMQQEQIAAGRERGSAGRLAAAAAAAAAAGPGSAAQLTPHTTHSTGSQAFASGANVLDSNQYLQDL
uniref:Protein kinase domain-containing protein n=1 Tax=Tetradesmus obliquus TaxID=3088 RepID=A0A383WP55_TETOB